MASRRATTLFVGWVAFDDARMSGKKSVSDGPNLWQLRDQPWDGEGRYVAPGIPLSILNQLDANH